jgi:hypothetical protein
MCGGFSNAITIDHITPMQQLAVKLGEGGSVGIKVFTTITMKQGGGGTPSQEGMDKQTYGN